MTVLAHHQPPPSAQEAELARISGQYLARFAHQNRPLSLRVIGSEQEQPIELPAAAVAMLADILESMSAGRGITIIPENAELTTVQAAEVLNVSRPFLIKLLDEGVIAHRKVGTHRRILMEDVITYKEKIDRKREAILDELVADAQEYNMGYGHP